MSGREKIVDRRPYTPRDQAGAASEEMVNLWEDVKAMFNGGTRRRFASAEITTHPNAMTTARQSLIPPSNHLIKNFCNFKTSLAANQEVIKRESQNQLHQGATKSFIESALQTRTTLDLPCSSSSKNSALNSRTTMSMQYSWLLDRYFNNNQNNYTDSMQTTNYLNSNVVNNHFSPGLPFWTSNPFLSQPIFAQQMHVISAHLSKNDHSTLTSNAITQQSVIINPSNHNPIDNQDHNLISTNRYDIRSLLMTKGSNADCNTKYKENKNNSYHNDQDYLNRENLIEQLRQTDNYIPDQDRPERNDL
uniref:Uncharacterized protein n=1 Tax=Romanomermis culicivorax TaxID=13658 RepID=A0A915K921_ROMCU